MKKILLSLVGIALLTGCPSQEEIKSMQTSIAQKKQAAAQVIQSQDYSLEGLLKTQEYFFELSERVHMVLVEEQARKNIERMIKGSPNNNNNRNGSNRGTGNRNNNNRNNTGSKNTAKEFCDSFVLPVRTWEPLQAYCSSGSFYRCSPEIKEYRNTLRKFVSALDAESQRALQREPSCGL